MCLLHTLPLVQFVLLEKERRKTLSVKSSSTLFWFTSTEVDNVLEESQALIDQDRKHRPLL